MIGVKDELESRGIVVPSTTATRSRQSRARRVIDATRAMRDEVNPMLFPALTFAALLTLGATSVVHYFYENRGCRGSTLVFRLRDDHDRRFGESPSPTIDFPSTFRYRVDVRR